MDQAKLVEDRTSLAFADSLPLGRAGEVLTGGIPGDPHNSTLGGQRVSPGGLVHNTICDSSKIARDGHDLNTREAHLGAGAAQLAMACCARLRVVARRPRTSASGSPFSIRLSGSTTGKIHTMPRGTDIALAEVMAGAASLGDVAIGAEQLATTTEPRVSKGDTVVAAGFPEQVSSTVHDHVRNVAYERHGYMSFRTIVAGLDRRAMSLQWDEADMFENHQYAYQSAAFPSTGRINQAKPSEISGGTVWKQLKLPRAVWTVESAFRLVGVLFKFTNQRQLAVPAACWADWVRERLSAL